LIWHTDMHQFSGTKSQIIPFIDDRSRKCLSHKVLPNKTSHVTIVALIEALKQIEYCDCRWTDNGSSDKGNFPEADRAL
jgi:hypothetical protein